MLSWIYIVALLLVNVVWANLNEVQICGYFKPIDVSAKNEKMVSAFDAKGFYKREDDQRLRIYHISVNIDKAVFGFDPAGISDTQWNNLDWGTVFYCEYVLDDEGKHFQVEWDRVKQVIDEMKGEPRWKSGAFNREKGDNCLNFVHEFVCKLVEKCPNHWPNFMVKMDEEWNVRMPSRKRLFPPKISVTKKMARL